MKDKAVVIHTPPRSTISRSSSNASYNRSGSSGSGNNGGSSSSTPLNTRYLFLKIGLAASVAFHFTWVATQLSSLGTHMNVDELLIAPEYTKEHDHRRDLYASSSSSSSGAGTYSYRRNKHPFDPRGKSLPKHPFPNAELQELVSSHLKYDCPDGLVYVADHILVSFSLYCFVVAVLVQGLFLASNYFICNHNTCENIVYNIRIPYKA